MREEARYVLYLWRDGPGEGAWRASLTDVRTRRVRRFRDTAKLQAFLDERTARTLADDDAAPPAPGATDEDDGDT
ncbi:MAG: hypothetical protein ABR510_13465 [Trueperaceae bacterium]